MDDNQLERAVRDYVAQHAQQHLPLPPERSATPADLFAAQVQQLFEGNTETRYDRIQRHQQATDTGEQFANHFLDLIHHTRSAAQQLQDQAANQDKETK